MGKPLDIRQIKQHALNKGGKCLSDHYEGGKMKLLWQCEKGHQWTSSVQSVVGAGSWCPTCARNVRLTIEEMQEIAKERGGKCLSTKYVNSKTKLLWECKRGHQWESTPLSVKSRKSWCPYCANNRAFSIEDMQQLAEDKRGKCLSTEYVNVKTIMLWQCNHGHIWESTADNVKQGRWCPHCKKGGRKPNGKTHNNSKRQNANIGWRIFTDKLNRL